MAAFDGTLRTRPEEAKRIASVKLPSWIQGVTIHAVSAPNMKQARETPYAQGSKMAKGPDLDKAFAQRLRNMKTRVNEIGGKGWHVTVFENGKFGEGCALNQQGSHASSWNDETLGLEMCFDGDSADPLTEGGKVIMDSAAWWTAEILKARGLSVTSDSVRFHNDEPAAKRKGKTCPGKNVSEVAMVEKVRAYMGEPVVEVGPVYKWVSGVPANDWLNTRRGPGTSYDCNGKLYNGIRLEILDTKGAWSYVKTPGGFQVWVGNKFLSDSEPVKAETPPVSVDPIITPEEASVPIELLHPSEFCMSWKKRFEGLRLEAYDDVGSWAIGYGHNATSNRPPIPYKGMKITEADANAILLADAEAIAGEVRKVLKGTSLKQHQFDALVLNCFQLGQTQFTKNKATQAIKAGKSDDEVYKALVAQSNATANAGLKRRRLVQAQIWNGEKPTKW